MGIHNSVMDIPLEGIRPWLCIYLYAFIASQRIHVANNVITSKQCCDFVSTYNDVIIDLINKSHNAQVPHTTMHHFVTGMCTCVHFSLAKWCIVGHLSNALWDLWDGSIALCVRWDRTTLPLRPRLHYIKHTTYTGCTALVVGST